MDLRDTQLGHTAFVASVPFAHMQLNAEEGGWRDTRPHGGRALSLFLGRPGGKKASRLAHMRTPIL